MRRARRIASSAAAPAVTRAAQVRMPFRWPSSTASLTSRDMPKSSAVTISLRLMERRSLAAQRRLPQGRAIADLEEAPPPTDLRAEEPRDPDPKVDLLPEKEESRPRRGEARRPAELAGDTAHGRPANPPQRQRRGGGPPAG